MAFDYKRYLASREWALLKEQVRERSGDLCERCRLAPYESTHHLTYARIGQERLEDLLAVCNRCHEFLSAKSDYDPVWDVEVLACVVNWRRLREVGFSVKEAIRDGCMQFVGSADLRHVRVTPEEAFEFRETEWWARLREPGQPAPFSIDDWNAEVTKHARPMKRDVAGGESEALLS